MASRTRADRYAKRRKNRIAERGHDLTNEQWADLQKAWNGYADCSATGGPTQRDTVLAISQGGRCTIDNVVPACRSCIASKRNDKVIGWMRRTKLAAKRFLVRQCEIRKELEWQAGDPS